MEPLNGAMRNKRSVIEERRKKVNNELVLVSLVAAYAINSLCGLLFLYYGFTGHWPRRKQKERIGRIIGIVRSGNRVTIATDDGATHYFDPVTAVEFVRKSRESKREFQRQVSEVSGDPTSRL